MGLNLESYKGIPKQELLRSLWVGAIVWGFGLFNTSSYGAYEVPAHYNGFWLMVLMIQDL